MTRLDSIAVLLDLVCRTLGFRFAALARVTEHQWLACNVHDALSFGMKPGDTLPIETTFCSDVRQSRAPIVIPDVDADPAYATHAIPLMYDFKSYMSYPVVLTDGTFFGTLCALDRTPTTRPREELENTFESFAKLAASLVSAEVMAQPGNRLETNVTEERAARQVGELREHFIAILGHDLRNPVAALASGTSLLAKSDLDPRTSQIVTLMQGSVLRINSLINNMMDFARGHFGDGIQLNRTATKPLKPVLDQVIAELQSVSEPKIDRVFEFEDPIDCDTDKIGQLLSNLLANALSHGKSDAPVKVSARTASGSFRLSVTNQGSPIPAEQLGTLFAPFKRKGQTSNREGLGLGLYIVSEIARAHGGEITVSSSEHETCFTFSMALVHQAAGSRPGTDTVSDDSI